MGKKGKGKGKDRDARHDARDRRLWVAPPGAVREEPAEVVRPVAGGPRPDERDDRLDGETGTVAPSRARTSPEPAKEEEEEEEVRPDTLALAERLTGAAVRLVRRIGRDDAALGVSATRRSALTVLLERGPLTLGGLAEAEGVTPPSMTRLVNALQADGYVERVRSSDDRRLVIVRATPKAAALLEDGRDDRAFGLAGIIAALPARDRATLDAATELLEGIVGRIPPR
jgi:DNA-binding MarR family transcriptional regulator